jgi:transposase
MPRERLPMRKIRDVLRLHADALSKRRIAVSLNIGRTAVGDYIDRATRAGLNWPLPDDLSSDEALDRLLFPPPSAVSPDRRPPPDWPALHRELRKPGVTLSLLWEEHRAVYPEGYGYSRFCELYRAWKGRLTPTMRQTHVAGEKMFVDYAGATVDVIDGLTGEVREAQVFVATLGASSYTYAEATWTQALPDWIGSHTRTFAFFGGVPAQVVPDNLKSGVARACLYDPEVNRTYADMATHYGTAILPARPRKPRDKAKVEVGVQVVERWILARLRNRRFFSLAELNQAIHGLLEDLNGRVTRHLGASRRQLFEELDRPALKPLSAGTYEYAEWKRRRAGLDYHVEVKKHYYSVPHALAKQTLWARITDRTVEIFHNGKRVAAHMRGAGNRRHTTVAEHMPSAHRRYASWTPERIRRMAAANGPNTETLIDVIVRNRPHPEQGFRSCIGILRLAKPHGSERLEAACERALKIGAHSYSSVASILKNNLDRRDPSKSSKGANGPAIDHANIRGSGYFH